MSVKNILSIFLLIILFSACKEKECWDTGSIDFEGSGQMVLNGEVKVIQSYFRFLDDTKEVSNLSFRFDTDNYRHEFVLNRIVSDIF